MKRKNILASVLALSLLTISIFSYRSFYNAGAASADYTVHRLTNSGGKIIYSEPIGGIITNFNEALLVMDAEAKKSPNVVILSSESKSSTKIVAADRSIVQSYPYRSGKQKGSATLNIFPNKSLGSATTYIAAHYPMFAYGYSLSSDSKYIVADVEIQGGRGFVEIDKVDIIPLIYIENNIPITLGGNENYYATPEAAYSMVVKPESYRVSYNNATKQNEIVVAINRTSNKLSDSSTAYGVAPDWLKTGTTYYSPDGITFYTDLDLKKKVSNEKFYAYFQWLPVRSMTNHNSQSMNNLLSYYGYHGNKGKSKYSVMYGNEQHFITQGLNYGMNPVLIFAQAALESGYGTSNYAVNRNNLFGWGAVDSNPDQAASYKNIGEGIEVHMNSQLSQYMDPSNWKHFGPAFGNKGSGITVKYASDPYYGIKVASLAYTLDSINGFKDYNGYKISVLKDSTAYDVRKGPSTAQSNWYKTKSGLKNQTITNQGVQSGFIKTNLALPVRDNSVSRDPIPVILSKEFGYIANTLTDARQFGPKGKQPTPPAGWFPPIKPGVTISDDAEIAYVNTLNNGSLNLREEWNTGSKVLASIPYNTKLTVYRTSNGWAQTTFNGKTGFVSADLLRFEEPVKPKPDDVTVSTKAETADVTMNLNLRESWTTDSKILVLIPGSTRLTVYRTSNGWAKTTYNGKTGYVSQDFLKFVTETPKPDPDPEPSYKLGDVNGDGKIDGYDMMAVKRHYLKSEILKGNAFKAADMDGNGVVDGYDMMQIKRIYLNNR